MKWAAAITTAPRKIDYLAAARNSIAEAGWPDAILVEDQNQVGSWPTFLRAIRMLRDTDQEAEALVVFQDDILVGRRCREYLDRVFWPLCLPDRIGVVSLYISSVYDAAWHMPPRWYTLPEDSLPRKAYGALAVVMPRQSVDWLLADAPGKECRTKTDIWLGRFCKDRNLAWVQPCPSFVSHKGEWSAIRASVDWNKYRHEGQWIQDFSPLLEDAAT